MEENSRRQLFFSAVDSSPETQPASQYLTMGVERLMGFRLSLSHKPGKAPHS